MISPFLDAYVTRKDDGSLKLKIYRKKTHTDQYLHFISHHSLQHKLGVVRTLYERSDNIVTDPEDQKEDIAHIDQALTQSGYPRWSFKEVREKNRK